MAVASVSSADGSTGSRQPNGASWLARASHTVVNALRGGEAPVDAPKRVAQPVASILRRRTRSDMDEEITPPMVLATQSTVHMSVSGVNIFNERWLATVQSRARTEGHRTGSLIGVMVGSIGLIPLGPVLMLLSAIAGLAVGLTVGTIVDLQKARTTRSIAEKELRRLTYLVRYALDQIHRKAYALNGEEFACEVIEEVIVEFKPYIQVAHLSPILKKKLLLLYSFVQDPQVAHSLWYFLNGFLERLNSTDLSISEFVRVCKDVFAPLVDVEKKLGVNGAIYENSISVTGQGRLEILVKLEEFLKDGRVKQILNSADTSSHVNRNSSNFLDRTAVYLSPEIYQHPPMVSARSSFNDSVDGMVTGEKTRERLASMGDDYTVYRSPNGNMDDEFLEAVAADTATYLDAISVDDSAALEGAPVKNGGGSHDTGIQSAIKRKTSLTETAAMNTARMVSGGYPRPSKALFQSFTDFINFDVELKHKMPITPFEFRFLYEKESEPIDQPGWDLAVDKKYIKILKFNPSSDSDGSATSSVLVRAYAILENQTVENVFYQIYDPTKRQSWDTNFSEISLVPNNDDCEVLYCQIAAPFGISPRDFLQYRRAERVAGSKTITILMRSAVHEAKPTKSGYIRAESYISGYVIRQDGSDVKLFIMSQSDIKGLIPKWIVNMVASKAPAQWVTNLTRACATVLEKEFANDTAAMNKFLTDYAQRNAPIQPDTHVV